MHPVEGGADPGFITPSDGGSYHCQHVESSGGRYEGGIIVSQQFGEPGSHSEEVFSSTVILVSEIVMILAKAPPTGGFGTPVSGSQQSILALQLSTN